MSETPRRHKKRTVASVCQNILMICGVITALTGVVGGLCETFKNSIKEKEVSVSSVHEHEHESEGIVLEQRAIIPPGSGKVSISKSVTIDASTFPKTWEGYGPRNDHYVTLPTTHNYRGFNYRDSRGANVPMNMTAPMPVTATMPMSLYPEESAVETVEMVDPVETEEVAEVVTEAVDMGETTGASAPEVTLEDKWKDKWKGNWKLLMTIGLTVIAGILLVGWVVKMIKTPWKGLTKPPKDKDGE